MSTPLASETRQCLLCELTASQRAGAVEEDIVLAGGRDPEDIDAATAVIPLHTGGHCRIKRAGRNQMIMADKRSAGEGTIDLCT